MSRLISCRRIRPVSKTPYITVLWSSPGIPAGIINRIAVRIVVIAIIGRCVIPATIVISYFYSYTWVIPGVKPWIAPRLIIIRIIKGATPSPGNVE